MTKELRSKNDEELLALFVRLKGQLLQMRFLHANGELDKPHKIQQIRQLIARVLTILHERQVDPTKVNSVASATILKQTATFVNEKVDETKHARSQPPVNVKATNERQVSEHKERGSVNEQGAK